MAEAVTMEAVLASYGPATVRKPSRIAAFGIKAMTRSWTTIPHVTHHDLIATDALDAARVRLGEGRAAGRPSPVPFLIGAAARALRRAPRCNAAFDPESGTIVERGYAHIGMAVDTGDGIVIAVIRDADAKSVTEIADESDALAAKARGKGLALAEMSGGSFTVSSLGTLGGTGFTPIVNAPEAAILGVSRMVEVPKRGPGDAIRWSKMLPVSLSYDHRVLNGADAGRFLAYFQEELDALCAG